MSHASEYYYTAHLNTSLYLVLGGKKTNIHESHGFIYDCKLLLAVKGFE